MVDIDDTIKEVHGYQKITEHPGSKAGSLALPGTKTSLGNQRRR